MSRNDSGGLLGDDVDEVANLNTSTFSDGGGSENSDSGAGGFKGGDDGRDDKDYFNVPSHLAKSQRFKGIAKNKKTGEVEVTVKLPSR